MLNSDRSTKTLKGALARFDDVSGTKDLAPVPTTARIRKEMQRVVKRAHLKSHLVMPSEDAAVEEQFMVVGIAFLDALADEQDIAAAYRRTFPKLTESEIGTSRQDGCRMLELVKSIFPSVGEFIRTAFSRAGLHVGWLAKTLKQLAEDAKPREALEALKLVCKLMEFDKPQEAVGATLAIFGATKEEPFPQAEVIDADIQESTGQL